MSSIINRPFALLKLQQKPMSFFFFWGTNGRIHCKEKRKTHQKSRREHPSQSPETKANVIVAKVSPSKTPENNPMKYISREKHQIGPDEEFFPHFLNMVPILFSSRPFPWFGIKTFLSQLTRNSYAGNKESDP